MLAVLDASTAIEWAYILVDYRPEHEVHNLFDLLELRVRQRASQLDNFCCPNLVHADEGRPDFCGSSQGRDRRWMMDSFAPPSILRVDPPPCNSGLIEIYEDFNIVTKWI